MRIDAGTRAAPPIVAPNWPRPSARTSKRMMIPRVMIPTISERAAAEGRGGMRSLPTDRGGHAHARRTQCCAFKLEKRGVMSTCDRILASEDFTNHHRIFIVISSAFGSAWL